MTAPALSEVERFWDLLMAGTIDLETAAKMARDVREQAEAEFAARTRYDCPVCHAVGSSPAHSPGCAHAARWAL